MTILNIIIPCKALHWGGGEVSAILKRETESTQIAEIGTSFWPLEKGFIFPSDYSNLF